MKATVLESADGRSVILAEDGLFYSIDGVHQTGEIIEYTGNEEKTRALMRRRAAVRRAAAVAACLILLLSGAFYSYRNVMVYADVTLEGDMPVKCSLNRKGEVIRIEAVDESGEALAEDMTENGIRGKDIETAIEYAENYIDENKKEGQASGISITVDCKNEKDEKQMEKNLNSKFARQPKKDSDSKAAGGKQTDTAADSGQAGSENSGADGDAAGSVKERSDAPDRGGAKDVKDGGKKSSNEDGGDAPDAGSVTDPGGASTKPDSSGGPPKSDGGGSESKNNNSNNNNNNNNNRNPDSQGKDQGAGGSRQPEPSGDTDRGGQNEPQ